MPIKQGRGWQVPWQTNLIPSKSHPVSKSNVGGLLFQTSLNSCVGDALNSHPSFTQSSCEWEINKETQEVLIWYCPDLFFRKLLLDARQDVPFLYNALVCVFPEWRNLLHNHSSTMETKKCTSTLCIHLKLPAVPVMPIEWKKDPDSRTVLFSLFSLRTVPSAAPWHVYLGSWQASWLV